MNDQCKKEFTVRESRLAVSLHIKTAAAFTHTHKQTHNQSRQEVFSMSLFYPVDSFSLFYQGCDSKESKNQQLNHGVILYTALSQ